MASTKLFLTVSLLSTFMLAVLSTTSTSPLFLWSNTQIFSGHNIQEINVVESRDVIKAVQSKEGPLAKYIDEKTTPEVIVIFVEPKLSTEQVSVLAHSYQAQPNGGAFANLKRHVETSKSSLVMPYVSTSSTGTNIINSIVSTLSNEALVFVAGKQTTIPKATQLTIPELAEKLNGNWAPMKNGVTDLIVVYFDSPAVESLYDDSSVHARYTKDDAILGQIVDSLQSVNYLAVFTSNTNTEKVEVMRERSTPQLRAFEATFGQNHNQLYTTFCNDRIRIANN